MDRRSWLWRRKSTEKTAVGGGGAMVGETDSSGGSISSSSLSERFSDDQAYLAHNPQSPEVTSKAASAEEGSNGDVKVLTEKLSAALLNINAKEHLVKQHAKVAEEAVSGWEKAEKEVYALKQQLEAATKKNSELEDRVGQLDSALRECMRQLRQGREEQEQRVNEALARKASQWESTKSKLETQLVELHAELQSTKTEAAVSLDSKFRQKLEAVEKENSSLKLELVAQAEELEIRVMERDLSTQAAEAASKQHLESIKKVAKLEAECRRLKAMSRKALPASDSKSVTASSIYVESFVDNQSDCGERLLAVESDARRINHLEINECNSSCSLSQISGHLTQLDKVKVSKAVGSRAMVPSVEIDLMDDFLEMERLAALPDTSSCLDLATSSDYANSGESPYKTDLEAKIHRVGELEEKLEKIEEEKFKLEMALKECKKQFEIQQICLKEAEAKLIDMQSQLTITIDSKKTVEEEVKEMIEKREVAELELRNSEAEIRSFLLKVSSLDAELQKERSLSAENVAKCQELEDKLSKMKCEAAIQHEAELKDVANFNGEWKMKQEKELAVAASKFAECQRTISSLRNKLTTLATLEDYLLDSEKVLDRSGEEVQYATQGVDHWGLHSGDLCSLDALSESKNGDNRECSLSLNPSIVSGNSKNGCAKVSA